MAMANTSNDTNSKARDEIRAFLESTKVTDVSHNKKQVVVEVFTGMTFVEAAKILWEHKILGAPVWDAASGMYCGIFDMRDMLSAVIVADEERELQHSTVGNQVRKWFESLELVFKQQLSSDSDAGNIITVSNIAAKNPFVALSEDATLKEVCDLLSQRGCHRVPIVDKKTGRCVRIVSQSGLLKFLAEHLVAINKTTASLPALSKYFEQTLGQAGFPYQKDVVTMPDTATARDVFEAMDTNRLSGIAVVDSTDGSLVGNTSASDIKLVISFEEDMKEANLSDSPSALNANIISYLSAMRQQDPTLDTRHPSARVRETSTLGHIIRLLAATGYHRFFVVDDQNVPVGVVSVSDIVAFLCKGN